MGEKRSNTWLYAKLVTVVIILIACVFGIKMYRKESAQLPVAPTTSTSYRGLDLDDPIASYQMLRYVAERGGDDYQRIRAIEWLDEQTRLQQALKPDQEAWLLSVIERGGNPDWDIETKLWLFNNAFNVLHMGQEQERLTALLQHLALDHPHKTMRLYALQHLELQRTIGHLTGPLADEIHKILQQLAHEPDGQVAGTALVNLVNWEGPEAAPSKELVELALELAADTARPDDIRVTAIHAIGDRILLLARNLASDATQPILVRKAAIASMGKYGTETDTETLKQLATENFRIAQAAEPALKTIRQRAANPTATEPVPF